MKYDSGKVSDLIIAYIGGGSRDWATKLMCDLALDGDISGTIRLYDIDKESARENEAIGNKISARKEAVGKWKYVTTSNIEETLRGADFVIISILPGTFKEMAIDVHLPEKYGIYQSVGDTTGPGGLMRALRTIPIYVDFANAIKKYSPDAWVINFTNPMSLCTRTLYEVFPEIKAFGCCHEVFWTQDVLVAMLKEMKNITVENRDDVKVNVLGINHFTWLDRASYKGIDLFPLYDEFTKKYAKEGFIIPGYEPWENSVFDCANMVKFDLFRRYGLIAAAGDRHLSEFLPPWYLKNPETAKKWKFHLTNIEFRINNRKKNNEERRKIISGEKELEIKKSPEESVKQIKAVLGLGDIVTNVNLPNKGQMEGFPEGAVVETNALFTKNSVRPVLAGKLPPEIENLVIRHSLNHETILKAAITKNRDLALKALLNDQISQLDQKDGEELLDGMLKGTKDYLPGWKI
jgi:galacturan 1,4-alpha-galacturonidase